MKKNIAKYSMKVALSGIDAADKAKKRERGSSSSSGGIR